MFPSVDTPLEERAADPMAATAELKAISETERIELLRIVAKNPACPVDLLAQLALRVPREVAANHVLQLHALSEGLTLVHRFPPIALENLLRFEEGAWLLPLVLSSDRETTRATAKVVPELSPSVYLAMLRDPSRLVRSAAAERRDLPEEAQERLVRDVDPLVQATLAARRDLAPELLLRLVRHGDRSVRLAAAKNPSTPGELLRWIVLHGRFEHVIRVAAKNPSLPVGVLREMASHPGTIRREMAAADERLPAELFALLAEDARIPVRIAVASNRKTPLSTLEKLAQDVFLLVRRGVASNHACSAELLVSLLSDKDPSVREFAARNPLLSGEHMARLVAQGELLGGVAGNRSLPPDLAARIAEAHPDHWPQLIGNPSVPPEVLASLVGKVPDTSLWILAQNPSLPVDSMERIARAPPTSSGTSPQLYLLRNPSLPRRLLEDLTRSQERWVAIYARRKLAELEAKEVAR